MPSNAEIEASLRQVVAPALHSYLPGIVALLAAIQADGADPIALGARLAELPGANNLLQALAGKVVETGTAVLTFGSGNQFGDIAIGDVAGQQLIKFHAPVSINDSGVKQHIQADAQSQIREVVQVAATSGIAIGALVINNYGASPLVMATTQVRAVPHQGVRVVLCYGRTSDSLAESLAIQLRLRGFTVWPGQITDMPTVDEIRDALTHADAVVVLFTPQSRKSLNFYRSELPLVWQRYGQPTPFWILPVLDKVKPADADRDIATSGMSIGDFRAFSIRSTRDEAGRAADIAQLARVMFENIVPAALRRIANDDALPVKFYTFKRAGPLDQPLLELNWSAYFPQTEDDPLLPPSRELWQHRLLPVLHDLRSLIGNASVRNIKLDPKLVYPAALAFGYEFRTPMGITLQIAQESPPRPLEWWGSDVNPADEAALQIQSIPWDGQGNDVTIEIGTSRFVEPAVTRTLRDDGLPVGQRIAFGPLDGAGNFSVRNAAHAMAIALRFRKEIQQVRNRMPPEATIHLFVSTPIALAVLLGQQLNRVGPVQCYDFQRRLGRYTPACILG